VSAPALCGIVGEVRTNILALTLLLATAGCGGSASGKADNDGGGLQTSCTSASPSLGTMSWRDDGTPTCATNAIATFTTTAQLTLFSLTAATPTVGISLSVESAEGPAAVGGDYACGTTDGGIIAGFSYTKGTTVFGLSATCAFHLNMQGTAGVHATGTFAGTATLSDGTTKTVTEGAFDAPVTLVSP
jgi:hypothetical protein